MKLFPDDWRIRLTSALGAGVCMAAAMMLGPMVGIEGILPGGLAIIVAIVVGSVLGQLVGRLLFQPSSGRPPDHPPHA
jgi:hypothetical protein